MDKCIYVHSTLNYNLNQIKCCIAYILIVMFALKYSFSFVEMYLTVQLVLFLLTFGFISISALESCGYESCPKPKPGYLNIHLVPHTHDDLGWLKTVDQYYYGANNYIQQASVQFLLDSAIEELQKDPSRRFIYVETGFFWRWWTNQNAVTQRIVRNLISTGQLEFINGGWCMNDEATAHYNAIIDQMSLGLRYLNDTFGNCALPRVAWQIDPFGHSREQASLFAQMGFDGLFFGRLDYQDKFNREATRNLETIWSGSPTNLGKDAWLFTGALKNSYNPPDGFCFDIFCGDEPIMDDPKLLGYNLERKVDDFINASIIWGSVYRTNNVLMPMGSDFQYLAAKAWYTNLDKLILHVNARQKSENSRVNIFYSTPSCYLKSVHEAGLNWSMKTDDYFPYASDPNAFWTGYFTSRPTLKYFIHKTNNFLQVCKQLAALANGSDSTLDRVQKLSEPIAIAQHHDAVAGTAKQHVTDDYSLRLSIGIRACEEVISSVFMSMQYNSRKHKHVTNNSEIDLERFQNSVSFNSNDLSFCHLLNISMCYPSESLSEFILSVYNPLGRKLQGTNVRIPVTTPHWKVESDSDEVPCETISLPAPVLKIPGRESSTAYFELVFPVNTLEPLTVTQFRISRLSSAMLKVPGKSVNKQNIRNQQATTVSQGSDIRIVNSKGVSFTLDASDGFLKSIGRFNAQLNKSVSIEMHQNFYFYKGMVGNNEVFENRSSGAYIFRPNGTSPIPVASQASYRIIKGNFVTEVHQTFSNWISQIIRLYDNSEAIEVEWLIGPIPINDDIGKEIITRYSTDLKSHGTFFTDANGREILKRKRNSRETWQYKVNEPIAGNYYPVNSRILLSESPELKSSNVGRTLIVLNDRAQGGSSLNDGELEVMLHRRLLHDDAFGVGEPLNETQYGKGVVVRGKHWLVLAGGQTGVPVSIHRPLAQEIYRNPVYTFQDASTFYTWKTGGQVGLPHSLNELGQKLNAFLPKNIHLLTLEKISQTQFLIRLEHFYESTDDDVELIKPVILSAQEFLALFNFTKLRETTLGGNQWKDEASRFDWVPKSEEITKNINHQLNHVIVRYREGDQNIVLNPMEIKTFILYN